MSGFGCLEIAVGTYPHIPVVYAVPSMYSSRDDLHPSHLPVTHLFG